MVLLNAFYSQLFNENRRSYSIGEAFQLAKLETVVRSSDNNAKFQIIGDPSLHLRFPENECQIYLNSENLRMNDQGEFIGSISTQQSSTAFDGQGIFELFDAPNDTLYSFEDQKVDYKMPGQVIYRSRFSIQNNEFSGHFFIPPLVREGDDCRISTYFWNEQMDGWGYNHDLSIQGMTPIESDTSSPEVSFEIIEGQIVSNTVSSNFILRVICSDSSGINISDKSHGISLYLIRGDTIETVNATPLFEYNINQYKTGQFDCPFIQQSSGVYRIVCQVYDNLNQVSIDSLSVFVMDSENDNNSITPEQITLSNNYPNPFNMTTALRFFIPEAGDVTVYIYNSIGQEVVKLIDKQYTTGTYVVRWNGRDGGNRFVASGLYFCLFDYKNDDRHVQHQRKMLLIR